MSPELRVAIVSSEPDSVSAAAVSAAFAQPGVNRIVASTVEDALQGHADIVAFTVDEVDQPASAACVLDAGHAVWLQQPLAPDRAGLSTLDAAVHAAAVPIGVAHRRYSRAIAETRAAILAGEVGVPFALHLDFLWPHPDEAHVLERSEIFAIDAALHLLGDGTVDAYAVRSEALTALSLGVREGVSATAIVGSVATGARESVRLRATRGSMTADTRLSPGDKRTDDADALAVRDLIAAVRGERTRPIHDYAAAHRAWLIADAIRESATVSTHTTHLRQDRS